MIRSKPFWILAAFWAALWIFWAFRFHGRMPAYMDTLEYAFPEKWVNVVQWRSGVIPLWNPMIACGTPHLAQSQPAPFYPPHLLWNLTGLFDWFFWMAQAHSAWAALGFFLWVRRRQAAPVAALLGAVSFGGCALMTQFWGFPTHLSTLSWVPWIFWACDRALEKGGVRRWAAFALCLAMQTLSGYAFFGLYTWMFLSAWLLVERRPSRAQWGFLALSAASALALSAVQWMPFLDYMGYARRDIWEKTPFCFTPREFLMLLWPDALGVPGTVSFKGVYGNYIYNPYFGLVPLGAFLAGLFARKWRASFFTAAALLVLLFTTGFRFLPDALQMRGLVNFLEPAKASPLFVFAALSAALSAVGKFGAGRSGGTPRWVVVLAVLWALDLAVVPFRLVHLVPDPYRMGEVARDARNIATSAGEGRYVTLREAGRYYPEGQGSFADSVAYSARWMVPNTNAVWGARSANGYLSNTVDGAQNLKRYLAHGVGNERLLDAAGVRALVLPERPPFPKYLTQMTVAGAALVRNAGAMPQGWRVDEVREFPDRTSVLMALMDPQAFLEHEVFTENTADGKAVRLPRPLRVLSGPRNPGFSTWDRLAARLHVFLGGKSTVESSRPAPCRQQFEVNFSRRGFLAFNETFAPGWRAWVDGNPQAVFRAYGLFMAVPVKEKGLHHVAFRYEPASFRLGLFLSLVSWAAAVLAGLVCPGRIRGFFLRRKDDD